MPETFNPNNVLLKDMKEGTVPEEYGTLVVSDVISNSVVMQAAQYEEMSKPTKKFSYFAEGPGAYWVGEGERIQTSTAKWLEVEMHSHKLAVIMPVSREFLQYTMSNFFREIRPYMAEAFYKKFDEATLLNVNNPFAQSLEGSITDTGQIITGDLTGDNILAAEGLVSDADYDVNGFISKRQNRSALRSAVESGEGQNSIFLYDRQNNTLDGQNVLDLKSSEMPKGRLYTGDFNQMRYGIPYNMNYRVSEDAQLSTITASDGNPVNLFEQELIALRATMDVAFMVIKDDAYAKIEPDTTTTA